MRGTARTSAQVATRGPRECVPRARRASTSQPQAAMSAGSVLLALTRTQGRACAHHAQQAQSRLPAARPFLIARALPAMGSWREEGARRAWQASMRPERGWQSAKSVVLVPSLVQGQARAHPVRRIQARLPGVRSPLPAPATQDTRAPTEARARHACRASTRLHRAAMRAPHVPRGQARLRAAPPPRTARATLAPRDRMGGRARRARQASTRRSREQAPAAAVCRVSVVGGG
jgi:hypothetical protein